MHEPFTTEHGTQLIPNNIDYYYMLGSDCSMFVRKTAIYSLEQSYQVGILFPF